MNNISAHRSFEACPLIGPDLCLARSVSHLISTPATLLQHSIVVVYGDFTCLPHFRLGLMAWPKMYSGIVMAAMKGWDPRYGSTSGDLMRWLDSCVLLEIPPLHKGNCTWVGAIYLVSICS